jgi:hypothetical protein
LKTRHKRACHYSGAPSSGGTDRLSKRVSNGNAAAGESISHVTHDGSSIITALQDHFLDDLEG